MRLGLRGRVLNHLARVSMTRPTGTQTRTFNYGTPPGNLLLSATNPKNGTVTYTYNSYQNVATRVDAKGQEVAYTYDSYARLTKVQPVSERDDRGHLPAGELLLRLESVRWDLFAERERAAGGGAVLWRLQRRGRATRLISPARPGPI